MTNSPQRVLIVGSHFVPPAKVLLQALPEGTGLKLVREPSNPYDPLAVEVWVLSKDLDRESLLALEEQLNGFGATSEEVLGQTTHKLGHVGASEGKPMLKARLSGVLGLIGTEELSEMADPLPTVRIEFNNGEWITACFAKE